MYALIDPASPLLSLTIYFVASSRQINLVGDADGIMMLLAEKLDWKLPPPKGGKRNLSFKTEKPADEPRRLGDT